MKISGKAYFFTSIAFLFSVLNNGNSTKLGHHKRSQRHKSHESLGEHDNDGEQITEKKVVHYRTQLGEDNPRINVIKYEKHLFPEQNIPHLEGKIHYHKEQQKKRDEKAWKRLERKERRRSRMLRREDRRLQRQWKRNYTDELFDELIGKSSHDNGLSSDVDITSQESKAEIPERVESKGHDHIKTVHKTRPIISIEKVKIQRRLANAPLNNLKGPSTIHTKQPKSTEGLLEDEHLTHFDEDEEIYM